MSLRPPHRLLILLTLPAVALGCARNVPLISPMATPAPALPFAERPVLVVEAEARERFAADQAQLRVAVEETSSESAEASRLALERGKAVQTALAAVVPTGTLATDEVRVEPVRGRRPPELRGPFEPRIFGHRARVGFHADELPVADGLKAARLALDAGATQVSLELKRGDCEPPLAELRAEAVRQARRRAQVAAEAAGAELGTLFRLKERHASCGRAGNAIQVHAQDSEDGSDRVPSMAGAMSESGAVLPQVEGVVRVRLVYELLTSAKVPSGQAAGEVHLGLTRDAQASSDQVRARVVLRATVVDTDPSAALKGAAARMAQVRAQLAATGVKPQELDGTRLQLHTRQRDEEREGARLFMVKDYVASVSLSLRTARFDQLGRWLSLAAKHGAAELEGPHYELLEPGKVGDEATREAVTAAVQDAQVLADAAERGLRAITQLRLDGQWIAGDDPLYRFLHGAPDRPRPFGRGAAAGMVMQDLVERKSAPGRPHAVVDITPPSLDVRVETAVGFGLDREGR